MAETKKKAAAAEATEETAAKKAAPKKTTAKKSTSTAAKKPAAKKAAAPKAEEAAPAVAEEKKPAKKAAPKKAPAKKEEPKAEVKPAKPAKPAVTQATSTALNIRVTPRKCRLVADIVRGKDVDEALAILSNLNKAASQPVSKVIKAAAADAVHNFKLNEEKLYVAEIQVGDGMKMKRFMPRGKGSSSGLLKRCAHIRVTVKERK